MRKVFLDNLPNYVYGKTKRINWRESIGCIIPFIYDDIEGDIIITGVRKTNNNLIQ